MAYQIFGLGDLPSIVERIHAWSRLLDSALGIGRSNYFSNHPGCPGRMSVASYQQRLQHARTSAFYGLARAAGLPVPPSVAEPWSTSAGWNVLMFYGPSQVRTVVTNAMRTWVWRWCRSAQRYPLAVDSTAVPTSAYMHALRCWRTGGMGMALEEPCRSSVWMGAVGRRRQRIRA